MPVYQDGSRSPLFTPIRLDGKFAISELGADGVSNEMMAALEHAPNGECIGWGIPFDIEDVVVIRDNDVSIEMGSITARWLVLMHTSDLRMIENGRGQSISPMRGN